MARQHTTEELLNLTNRYIDMRLNHASMNGSNGIVNPQSSFLKALDAFGMELAGLMPHMNDTQWEAFSELVYITKNSRTVKR